MSVSISRATQPNTSRTQLDSLRLLAVLRSSRFWLAEGAWRDWRELAAVLVGVEADPDSGGEADRRKRVGAGNSNYV
jgi:hypothetical protein